MTGVVTGVVAGVVTGVVAGVVTGVVAGVVTGVVTGVTVTTAEPELSDVNLALCCAVAVKVLLAAEGGTVAEYVTAMDDGGPAMAAPGGDRARPVIMIVIAFVVSEPGGHAAQVVKPSLPAVCT